MELIFDERKIGEFSCAVGLLGSDLLSRRKCGWLSHAHDRSSFTGRSRTANLQPPDSPYANLSVTSLREQADSAKESMDQMKRAHEDRMRYFKENLSPAFLEKAHREAEEGADLEESAEPWSRGASKGKVVSQGFAYARAPTPDFIKAARQSRESTQAAAEESSKMNVDADADADADGDADADADADVDADAEGEGQDESATWTPEERKEKEKEFLQELHVKHGMESSTPPAPSDAPATAGQGPQAQQPGTEQAQQPSQPADAPAAPQSTSEAPASASAPESSTQDAEMVDVVQGDTGAGIAVTGGDTSEPPISSVEANPASAAAPEAPSTLPPAESASVTHPLSAEAAAASQDQAPASADKTEASETQAAPQPTEPVPGTSSSETQPPATTEAAGSTAEPSVAPATSSAADATEGAAASQPTETPVPAPAPEATAPTTAEASSAEQPAAAAMKAPTPPLNENLADNDAPLDFDAVVSASAEPSSDKAASGDAANAPQPETQGSTTASSETAGFQNP